MKILLVLLFVVNIFSFNLTEIKELKKLGFSKKEILKLSDLKNKKLSILDKIITSKKLIVGTTGDYAPFSYKEKKGNYSPLKNIWKRSN